MKNIKKYIGIIVLVFAMSTLFAQTPPPPNNGTTGSGGSTPVGGGAPIGGGLLIMASAALAYAYASYLKKKPEYTIEEES
ncbi:hypothetical protein [Lentimicrobium sp. S6]|uniref:hypothetical protein n=1 Tax=Lentimicrobium sp. S6 TaxID=2735872 RepID=UPI001555F8EC|nr:hypothetical protein [Lentimicrobium sp. S6]NPD47759.1 hypothetical protein [Lentimicrobium sp. S6]